MGPWVANEPIDAGLLLIGANYTVSATANGSILQCPNRQCPGHDSDKRISDIGELDVFVTALVEGDVYRDRVALHPRASSTRVAD